MKIVNQGDCPSPDTGAAPSESHCAGLSSFEICKRACDYIVSAVLLILLAPLILLTIVLVRLTSKGSPIYLQKRLGRGGKPFVIIKLRTMYQDCELHTGARWATVGDPRITPVGRFLRKTHLDELPQLLNVLRGEMSLVGPRPERPEIVCQLEKVIPGYRDRESMRPGVTGLAQIQLPPDTSLEDVRQKLACDLYYKTNASIWLDLRIILSTAAKVVGIPGSVSCAVLGIPRILEAKPTRSPHASNSGLRAGMQGA